MKVTRLAIPEVILLDPQVFRDDRGYFFESFNASRFTELTGIKADFIQDNHSQSHKNVLRGLHYQLPPKAQGKLVRVTKGAVFDVAVDIRKGSLTFGKWVGEILSEENQRQLWIPAGFAHGFVTLSDKADFLYKTTDYYDKNAERSLKWDDPAIGIKWPIEAKPLVSAKDQESKSLFDGDLFP